MALFMLVAVVPSLHYSRSPNVGDSSIVCERRTLSWSLLFVIMFSLALFLLLSGDVETNPGPTLKDKPTKDELIQLIMTNAVFTNGTTWEQFMCHLPNMSQEIIENIKQQSETPANTMTAVAQYWLDDSQAVVKDIDPPSWSHIVHALEQVGETSLAHEMQEKLLMDEEKSLLTSTTITQESLTSTELIPQVPQNEIIVQDIDIESVYKTIKDVLTTHFFSLTNVYTAAITGGSIDQLSAALFAKKLITSVVRDSQNYAQIHEEFVASLRCQVEFCKITESCQIFLNGIACVSKEKASVLAEDLEQKLLQNNSISITFNRTCLPHVDFSSKSEVAEELKSLQKTFTSLVTKIKKYYRESGKYEIEEIGSWVSEYEEKGNIDVNDDTTIIQLFNAIQKYIGYNFLNFEVISGLVEEFPIEDEKIAIEFQSYEASRDNIKDLTQFKELIDNIKTALKDAETTGPICEVEIRLTGNWAKKSIADLQKFINYLFKGKAKFLKLVEIGEGSIVLRFIVPCPQVSSLLVMAQSKAQYLHHLGVFYLSISTHPPVVNEREDMNFTFEVSLLHAITNIENEREYEKIAFLLIELRIDPSYLDEEGRTALSLAANGGHIEIFKSLLWNYPTITLNSEGLNSLACTALAEHMYKSVGGIRIVPPLEATVKEFLMRAKNQGTFNPLLVTYDSFVSLIVGKLRERFRLLQTRYDSLRMNIITSLTNLVNRGTVKLSTINHHLQSYIRQDIQCNNVHTLFAYLLPHISCFNISLLNDISKQFLLIEIQEQVESYTAELTTFEQITQLLELKMATDESPIQQLHTTPHSSKLVIKFNNQWGTRTIADLHKFEQYILPKLHHYLNLVQTHREGDDSLLLVCTYLIPSLQVEPIVTIAMEQRDFITSLGISQIILNDDLQLLIEDIESDFTFYKTLLQAVVTRNDRLLRCLLDLNVPLESEEMERRGIAFQRIPSGAMPPRSESSDDSDEVRPKTPTSLVPFSRPLEEELYEYDPQMIPEEQMFEAILLNDVVYVRKLIREGVYIDYENTENGRTFLITAAITGNEEIFEMILNQNPELHIRDGLGNTALIYASASGHRNIARLLLDADDSEINIQNNDGMTALILAACRGHKDLVELLLERGADRDIRNNDGNSALDFAQDNSFNEIADLLQQ